MATIPTILCKKNEKNSFFLKPEVVRDAWGSHRRREHQKNTKTTKKLTTRTPFLPNPPGSGSEPRTPGKGGKKKSLFLHPPLPPPGGRKQTLGLGVFFEVLLLQLQILRDLGEKKANLGCLAVALSQKGAEAEIWGPPTPKPRCWLHIPGGRGIPLPSGGCKFVNVLIKAR